jgi:hypothetical protein
MSNENLARELERRLRNGATIDDLYAEDAYIHRNTPPYRQPVKEHVAMTREAVACVIPDIHEVIEDIRYTPDVLVLRKAEVGTFADGSRFYSPATVIYRLEGGRITRADGWVDLESVGRLAVALAGTPYGAEHRRG